MKAVLQSHMENRNAFKRNNKFLKDLNEMIRLYCAQIIGCINLLFDMIIDERRLFDGFHK